MLYTFEIIFSFLDFLPLYNTVVLMRLLTFYLPYLTLPYLTYLSDFKLTATINNCRIHIIIILICIYSKRRIQHNLQNVKRTSSFRSIKFKKWSQISQLPFSLATSNCLYIVNPYALYILCERVRINIFCIPVCT